MKVLQINSYLDFGSTGGIVRRLLNAQLAAGIDGYVLFGRHTGIERESERTIAINTEAGVALHKLLTFVFGKHAFYSRFRTLAAMKKIKALRPDIVHLHNVHGHYLHIGVLFRFLTREGIPVIWTFHDCWPYTGHCPHYSVAGCNRWKHECGHCPQKTGYPESLIFDRSRGLLRRKRKLFTGARELHIVTVSQWLAGEVRKSFLRNADLRVIHNGINTEVFHPLPNDEETVRLLRRDLGAKFIILGVASFWDNRKGLDRFLHLASLLAEDEMIVLLGRFAGRARPWQRKKESPVLPHNIRVISTISDKAQIAAYYNAADVHVSFSREESFGLTIAEAMACATPVVVMDSTAAQEVVGRDGHCGMVLSKDAPATEAYAAIRAIREKGKRSFGESGPARVREYFDQEKNEQAYIRLYQDLYESTGSGGLKAEDIP